LLPHAVKDVCKAMNEYFIVPMLSDVLDIVVVEDDGDEGAEGGGDDDGGRGAGGESAEGGGSGEPTTTTTGGGLGKRRRARSTCGGGTVTIVRKDSSKFIFPRHDCLVLPIMHTTAKELAIYLYGKVLSKLNAELFLPGETRLINKVARQFPFVKTPKNFAGYSLAMDGATADDFRQ
jgi:hypothetical protein